MRNSTFSDATVIPKAYFQLGDFACLHEQTKKLERFLLVRGEFFRQPILTNHVAGFLFSLRVARIMSSSGK